MKMKLLAALSFSLLFTLSAVRAVPPGGSSAGPNDFDRFNSASSPDGKSASDFIARAMRKEAAGDFAGAIADYGAAIAVEPKSAIARFNRGYLLSASGRFKEAILDFDVVIRGNPRASGAYLNRAHAHAEMGQRKAALADYENAIQHAGTTVDGDMVRAKASSAKGDYAAAASLFAKAKRRSARDTDVLNSVAWFKATCPNGSFRNGQEAVQESTKACEISKWRDGELVDTLAAAYAETGDFAQAIKYQTQALAARPPSAPDSLTLMQRHLRSYQARKPFREESKLR
jgi:tetratricopeptide (TPR) repeat protein